MKKLRLYLIFYKSTFLFPLIVSVLAFAKEKHIGTAIFALFFATLGIFFYNHFIDDPKKQRLYFFFNHGISETKLYGFIFVLNALFLTALNLLWK
ncbi:hypothetical protein [Pseudotenacibaculum haliotis]|uniref:ABC transporter permease n=1 Tax=Pseudotenacibaculum haliotis TaxID=1862138 RepID=A0ABW5LXC5_9FLAO